MQEEYKPAAIYSPISIGNWIISLILTMIPIVNIIMLFVWAFSNGTNPRLLLFRRIPDIIIQELGATN